MLCIKCEKDQNEKKKGFKRSAHDMYLTSRMTHLFVKSFFFFL